MDDTTRRTNGMHPIRPTVWVRMTQALTLATAALLVATGAQAQPFPSRAVRLVHTFPAGGPVDFVTRGAADELSKLWGQPVIVDPRPGGGGSIGSEIVRVSPPDGYTLLTGTHSGMVAAPLLIPAV
jgi:tripartite-type tricarboxylate transporter receptor subunit TctC